MTVFPSAMRDDLASAVGKAACQALGASEAFGNAVAGVWKDFTGLDSVNPPNFAGIVRGLFCSEPSPIIPPGTTFPQGAQCDCVIYTIQGQLRRRGSQPPLGFNTQFWGPLAGLIPVFGTSGITTYNLNCKGQPPGPCQPSFGPYPIGAGSSAEDIEAYEIFRIFRNDGLDDNCGSPPPEPTIPPPDFEVGPFDFTFDFRPNFDITPTIPIPGAIIFLRPEINFNGQLVVPFNVNLDLQIGPINFNPSGTINFNTGDINFNFNFGNPPKSPGINGPCDEPTKPVRDVPDKPPTVPGKPDDPDVEPNNVIVGAVVSVSSTNSQRQGTKILQAENPDIFAPSLGFINFFCPYDENGNGAWTADIPVKNEYQLVPCPWPEGASGVAGTPNPGVVWEITPVVRAINKPAAQEE